MVPVLSIISATMRSSVRKGFSSPYLSCVGLCFVKQRVMPDLDLCQQCTVRVLPRGRMLTGDL